MIHLRSVSRRDGEVPSHRFPFSVPAIRDLPTLSFTHPVTFFVGENGSGKSTLLEAIAAAARLPTIGSSETRADPTLVHQRELGDALTLAWTNKRTTGFFLRAEDFFGFAKSLAKLRAELLTELDDIKREFADASPYARGLRAGPIQASLSDMERRYGFDLDAQSHGEGFLALFRTRFVPGGLYLLDEPEAPLSPQSQLGLIRMIYELVQEGGQFLIATHSPILLAFPGAAIWSFDEQPIASVSFASLDHANVTRDFLNAPEQYLRRLTEP